MLTDFIAIFIMILIQVNLLLFRLNKRSDSGPGVSQITNQKTNLNNLKKSSIPTADLEDNQENVSTILRRRNLKFLNL